MLNKLNTLWPEMSLLIGATLCLLFSLSRQAELRRLCSWFAVASLILAGALLPTSVKEADNILGLGHLPYVLKAGLLVMGILLVFSSGHLTQQVKQAFTAQRADNFQPELAMQGEYYFFLLTSLAGAMLCTTANDLAWLFLALELTSLPTYVLIAASRDQSQAQESAIKYFFLGALSAAIFLYGFTLIYGATGHTDFELIRETVQGKRLSDMFLMGVALSVVGISLKIAAFPMHFYAADVYQGACSTVTGFLAVVPKTAGFAALMLLLSLVRWPLPEALFDLLLIMALVTMTLGNVMGLIQQNVKRTLAYSSIAHSGYLLLGLLIGTQVDGKGLGAVAFYLLAYGAATIGSFAVLGLLTTRLEDDSEDEVQTYDQLKGLHHTQPALALILAICMLSLIGLPPLGGFFGKAALFLPIMEAGYTWLVVIALINSAISAGYYLRIVYVCYLPAAATRQPVSVLPAQGRRFAAITAALLTLALGLFSGVLVEAITESYKFFIQS